MQTGNVMLDPETMPHEFAIANSRVKEITNTKA